MANGVSDKSTTKRIIRHIETARSNQADSLEKLASGTVFTKNDPRPSERHLAERMQYRLRSLASAKRNVNDAVTLLQTAESGLSEINNILTRMKEINVAAASTTVNDQERRFLLVEYEALHDEINRIAVTTDYNGVPLINGTSEDAPEEMIFRVGEAFSGDTGAFEVDSEDDINTIRFSGLKRIVATTEGLGVRSARELLEDANDQEGITFEDAKELMEPEDDEYFSSVYDEALQRLAGQRSVLGALQARMSHSLNYIDVYEENIAAARSNIADTDYTQEVARLVENKILLSAGTSALAHSNINAEMSLRLLGSAFG